MDSNNWLAILKWSLAQTDGTSSSEIKPMSEEDKKWLEQVVKEGVKDEPARMKEIMENIIQAVDSGMNETQEDKILNDLEELKDMVEQIDMAQVFSKFGGLVCLWRLLDDENISNDIKIMTASTIGTLSQNNIAVQDLMFQFSLLDKLIPVYIKTDSPKLCTKVMFAISCMIRGHAAMEELFISTYSSLVFMKAFESKFVPLLTRILFCGNALIMSENLTIQNLENLIGIFIPNVFGLLLFDDIDLREKTINLISSLLKTEKGWNKINNDHNEIFNETLQNTLILISKSEENSVEQKNHEKQTIGNLRELYENMVIEYPRNQLNRNTEETNIQNDDKEREIEGKSNANDGFTVKN